LADYLAVAAQSIPETSGKTAHLWFHKTNINPVLAILSANNSRVLTGNSQALSQTLQILYFIQFTEKYTSEKNRSSPVSRLEHDSNLCTFIRRIRSGLENGKHSEGK